MTYKALEQVVQMQLIWQAQGKAAEVQASLLTVCCSYKLWASWGELVVFICAIVGLCQSMNTCVIAPMDESGLFTTSCRNSACTGVVRPHY